MTESDSLDRITLDSADIQTIERFENHYYNHKNNVLQNGGNNNKKLEKNKNNIIRLYYFHVLSQNQNGGNNNLSYNIKKRLNKKIVELANDLTGGSDILKEINSLLENIVQSIDNTKIDYLKNILKAPTEIYKTDDKYKDYKNWLSTQIKNWTEKNKEEIINQINQYIEQLLPQVNTSATALTLAPATAPSAEITQISPVPVQESVPVPLQVPVSVSESTSQQVPVPVSVPVPVPVPVPESTSQQVPESTSKPAPAPAPAPVPVPVPESTSKPVQVSESTSKPTSKS